LTALRPCTACGVDGAPTATYCRRCGTKFQDAPLEAAPALARASQFDDRRLLRELAWLCAAPVLLSIAYAVHARIFGLSAAAVLVTDGSFAAVALVGALRDWSLVRDALRLPTLRGVGSTLLVAAVVAPTLILAFALIETLGFDLDESYFEPFAADAWPVWTAYVSIAVLTPLTEELLFRGLIQPKLEPLVGTTEALIVQAALFSAIHLSVVILLTHFAMGLAFGWIRRSTRSLLPSVLLHGAWNAGVLWEAMH